MRGENVHIEDAIKDFVLGRGIDVVGIAGPERLDGPPSLDLDYTMPGARSIVVMAIPMDVDAIYKFLSKESPTPHNVDQVHANQRIHQVSRDLADHITSLGHRAAAVPPNNTYRRSLDVFTTRPSFSHRFGAIAAGIAGQGWSGNVMTKKYGAAVHLGTVVTAAALQSDPSLPPRYFVDGYCSECKLCVRTCVAGMFEEDEEDYVLLNGELHPRARRRNIDLCNASCFGLHALSKDKEWSTWGRHWIKGWIGRQPPDGRVTIRRDLMFRGGTSGDATPRFDFIRREGKLLFDRELLAELPKPEELPDDQQEMDHVLSRFQELVGTWGRCKDPNVLTCGQCALVCGPTLKETRSRFNALVDGGIVVPGTGDGEMVKARDYADAVKLRESNSRRASTFEIAKDALASSILWHRYYFGLEPRSILHGWLYEGKRKKAVERYLVAP